jgi:hypothetical protein
MTQRGQDLVVAKTVARRGPKTVRGKITAAMNSTKHGILSPKPVVTHFESEGGWRTHRQSILDSLDPANGIEQALAERVALNSWRLNRVAAYETLQLSAAQEDLVDDMRRDADKYSSLHAEEAKGFEGLDSAEWQRAVHNDVVGFYHEIISELGSQHTMEWLYNQAPYYALELAAWQQNPGIDLEEAEYDLMEAADGLEPSFSERLSHQTMPDLDAIRGALGWLVNEAGVRNDSESGGYTAYEGLMEKLCTVARGDAEHFEEAASQLDKKIVANRRAKLMLNEDQMQKLARYEAHLSREMYKALHELEALQKRRAGEPTPLARVDISGIPEALPAPLAQE